MRAFTMHILLNVEFGEDIVVNQDILNQNDANTQKLNWEAFIKQDVLNFLMAHNLQAITVDDGAGKKGVIKRSAKGELAVQITSNEKL
ncbi:hypothetical protein SPTER_37840 [Sporomusa termitida]|uniref:Uncharacterized protein n=1 Tax=Sporomusa termitida TaxID=2377 RepID=A0A517DYB9_9FIRM|nr:hypothetical protein SPTER_37840 [Sporomusa termitida]